MDYKYKANVGALNEAVARKKGEAPALRPPPPPPAAMSMSMSMPRRELAAITDFEDYAAAHNTDVGTRMPVAQASMHAQAATREIDPHTGRVRVGRAMVAREQGGAVRGGLDTTGPRGGDGVFFWTVQDGQRVRVIARDGTVEVIDGPKRIWVWSKRVEPMEHFVAHPGEFLIVRHRDGKQEHHPGPVHLWLDPREHLSITREDALQIAAREAVVVYARDDAGKVSRRVVNGPAMFVPSPGEWLHTFSWHGSRGGSDGYAKVPNALVFQKLWFLPDQMYHDVPDVRTADDAVLTIRLMIFFELVGVDTMLETTHDPIGDFVNAATSDVVDFTGRHDFDSFKRNTERLNDLATYAQLTARADQCGYRINKVVYRGYGAPENLQRMHDEAIESRTRLQLERATRQQAEELEDFKQERDVARHGRHRAEEAERARHQIGLAAERQSAEITAQEALRDFERTQRRRDAELREALTRSEHGTENARLEKLRALGVDLTKLLTQSRADRVIEVRGGAGTQVHLDPRWDGGEPKADAT